MELDSYLNKEKFKTFKIIGNEEKIILWNKKNFNGPMLLELK